MYEEHDLIERVKNIEAKVEELYSDICCDPNKPLNPIPGLKSAVAKQAKEITDSAEENKKLWQEIDRLKQIHSAQQETIKGLLVERDNLAASLEAEKVHANACNNNFYEYRLSTEGAIKGYQQELEKARSERDTAKALNEQLNADFGVLAENHKALGEQYSDLQLRYENSACQLHKLRDDLKDREATIKMLKDDLEEKVNEYSDSIKFMSVKEVERLKIELAAVKQELGDQLYYREIEVNSLKDTIKNLKTEVLTYKTRYANKTIEFNKLRGESLDLKKEYDNLTIAADKYSWKRVDRSEPFPFEDHELYLFAIDGYSTPVKGKFHDDTLSKITIIVDDGKGKGPEQKVIFFIDGHIRYWRPLPEMPDMPKGVDDND